MKLTVNASTSYDIIIENNFNSLQKETEKVFKKSKVLIVSDTNVARVYLNEIEKFFNSFDVYTFVFHSGENYKNFDTLKDILKSLSDNCFNRDDFLVALGGGVVGDISGLASSLYMRGIRFMSIPTTLLSDIDSSVGGKTAIDFNGIKNNIGTFHQPSLVYINIGFLKTLPKIEIESGLGEAVKYAFLSKTVNTSLLKMSSEEDIVSLIYECLKIKKDIVESDEFDKGKRFLLNLGHTIGHSIEALSLYTIPHGVCVVKGIKKVIDMSTKYYNINDNIKNDMFSLLNSVNIDTHSNFSNDDIIKKLSLDKKAKDDGVNFVLLKNIGDAKIQYLTFSEINTLLS